MLTDIFRTPRYGSSLARELMKENPAFDWHIDSLTSCRLAKYDFLRRHRLRFPRSALVRQVDLPRMQDGLVGGAFFGLVALPIEPRGYFRAANRQIDILEATIRRSRGQMMLVRTAEEIELAKERGVVAATIAAQGAHILGGDIDNLVRLAKRGVRSMTFGHFTRNRYCCPAKGLGQDDGEGLSIQGGFLMEACEANGVIADLAHVNRRGSLEACRMAKRPLVCSHGALSAVHPHWRNTDNVLLRAIADTGGLFAVMASRTFLGGDLEWYFYHLERAINEAGEDHVGIGTDFDGFVIPPKGLSDISMMPNLVDMMIEKGRWSTERIVKVLRLNALRVMRDVPAVHTA